MTQGVLLIDGGLGQELVRRSPSPAHHQWSLQVMLEHPNLVAEVHRDYFNAGAKVACINTYAITRSRVTRGEELPSIDELLNRALQLAKRGANLSDNADAAMIASLPPLVASYRPDTQLPLEQAISEYKELIDMQKTAVDGFLAETIPSVKEAQAVLTAARQADVRIMLALTVSDENGQVLRSGEPLVDALSAIESFEPLAVVINCSKPEVVSQALPVLAKSRFRFGAFANGFTSVTALEPGGVVDVLEARQDLGPDQYAAFANSWLDAGATVIGGCCEVGPDHIKALDILLQKRGHEKLAWRDLAA